MTQQEWLKNELGNFDALSIVASAETLCKRKGVCAAIFQWCATGWVFTLHQINNPVTGNKDCKLCANAQGQIVPGGCAGMHAEQKAIRELWRLFPGAAPGHSKFLLICSYSPCTTCANHIVDFGCIPVVIYKTLTEHDKRGVEILKRAGVSVLSFEDCLSQNTATQEWVNDVLSTG